MNGFLKATFNRQKFQGLFINTALGNFAAYVAGSLVTLVTTHYLRSNDAPSGISSVSCQGKKSLVHDVPPWLEWLLRADCGASSSWKPFGLLVQSSQVRPRCSVHRGRRQEIGTESEGGAA